MSARDTTSEHAHRTVGATQGRITRYAGYAPCLALWERENSPMRSSTYDARVATLVIAQSVGTPLRANELRLHGYPAWVAANEEDLRWLLEQANVRPEYTLVDLASWSPDRSLAALLAAARLARRAGLPLVLIGADEHEVPVFQGVVASLPATSDIRAILGAMRRAAA
jgi:hypothetical protein